MSGTQRHNSGLERALLARGLPWPGGLWAFDLLTSTNDRLKELARQGAPDWTAVTASRQTQGRGRRGRSWVSPAGNLYLSVLLPMPGRQRLSLVPLLAGVAVHDALRERGVSAVELKWPNDLLVGGRKIAGVLAEAEAEAEGQGRPDARGLLLVGIGVNLVWDLDERLGRASEATAVDREGGTPTHPVQAAAAVLARLTVWYDELLRDPAQVTSAWRDRSVAWWGQWVEAQRGSDTVQGVARDIDASGALILEQADQRTLRIFSGDVRRVRLAL